MAAATMSMPPRAGVRVTFDRDQEINRLWGIPFFGLLARGIILIPHFLIVWVLGVASGLSVLVTWIPILVNGRFPSWALDLYEMTYRWTTRVSAYWLLMAAPYPPFSSDAPYPVDLVVDARPELNRLWGIPFIGIGIRGLLVIPHSIVVFILGIGIGFALLVTWIPVLLNGRMPQLGYDLFGAYLRLSARISLWSLLVPIPYPPISPNE